MSIAVLSDVHVKRPHDLAYHLLLKFLKHDKVQNCQHIILLGDIFDLMCGPHAEYFELYKDFFDLLKILNQAGLTLHYFEGNHDLHLSLLFQKFIHQNQLDGEKILIHQRPFYLDWNHQNCYFSHGDEIDGGDLVYRYYKKTLMSLPLKWVANYLMPFEVLHFLGERASQNSRKRQSEKPFNENLVREVFRQGARKLAEEKGLNIIVLGHNHLQDDYEGILGNGELSVGANKPSLIEKKVFRYLNNGYALKSKTFLYFGPEKIQFLPL